MTPERRLNQPKSKREVKRAIGLELVFAVIMFAVLWILTGTILIGVAALIAFLCVGRVVIELGSLTGPDDALLPRLIRQRRDRGHESSLDR